MLFLWLGITAGVCLGGIPLLFQKTSNSKIRPFQLAATALGAFLPAALLVLLGLTLGINHPFYHSTAPLLAVCSIALGLIGFHIPSWFMHSKRSSA